jgi:hypothetical protein
MKGFMMPSLNDDVREVIEELDPDGGGFRTGEAANLLVRRVVVAGVCDADGEPKPKVRQFMRMGAGTAVHGYKEGSAKNERMRERATETAAGAASQGQHDFHEIADDFERRWLLTYHAWEEDDDAERKKLIRMSLPEVQAVIALKTKKANEARAVAKRLQTIIDRNPSWHDHPSMTLADVLGISE